MKFRGFLGLAVAALFSFGTMVEAQAQVTLPYVQKVNPNDAIQDIPNGAPSVGNVYASVLSLVGYGISAAAKLNVLVGGDAGTNLFVHGTTGSSVTTTLTYGGPNNFAYWSGASTAMTVSKDTTAADLPATAYAAGFKIARTSGQTGVIPLCVAQEVESANTTMFQGQVAEVDFWATAGSNFSPASGALTAYIITGTGTDEGLSKMAFAFNAGGGGSSTWAGQATTVADVASVTANPTRFAAVGVIPTTATEMAVVLCDTPVGTAGTNDFVTVAGLQLTRNAALASIASATTATDCSTINCSSFDRRPQALETSYQERYAYAINEASITAGEIVAGGGTALGTTTTCSVNIRFPVTMRAAPTYTNALTASTFKLTSASQAATALSTPFSATLVANSVDSASINFTTTGMTAKDGCELVSAAGTGQMLWTSEL